MAMHAAHLALLSLSQGLKEYQYEKAKWPSCVMLRAVHFA